MLDFDQYNHDFAWYQSLVFYPLTLVNTAIFGFATFHFCILDVTQVPTALYNTWLAIIADWNAVISVVVGAWTSVFGEVRVDSQPLLGQEVLFDLVGFLQALLPMISNFLSIASTPSSFIEELLYLYIDIMEVVLVV